MIRMTKPITYGAFAALLVLVFFATAGARALFDPALKATAPQVTQVNAVNGCVSIQLSTSQRNSMLMACPASSISTAAPEVKLFDCGADACVAPVKQKVTKTI